MNIEVEGRRGMGSKEVDGKILWRETLEKKFWYWTNCEDRRVGKYIIEKSDLILR